MLREITVDVSSVAKVTEYVARFALYFIFIKLLHKD